MKTVQLTRFLDKLLRVKELNKLDDSNNGLQVQGGPTVKRVGLSVDACMSSFRQAVQQKCDLVLCHHGVSWNDSLKYITGLNHRRISFLNKNRISLYAAHLPLDCHPRYGNNAVLCRKLGVKKLAKFGMHKGAVWGYSGKTNTTVKALTVKVERLLGIKCQVLRFGSSKISRLGVVSGSGGFAVEEAAEKGIQCLLTGETSHLTYRTAQDLNMNVIFAGHYATETVGLKSLGSLLSRKFKLSCAFLDSPTGM